jgi:signal recognition particle receptor subunit beta
VATFSAATRELVLKIVYYGPGLGGKTTSLKALHAAVRPEHRGRMISLATPVDRTLYFDFLPVRLPSVGDLQIRLQLFTVPGQVYFNATRKLVLTGADGVIFVADSQTARLDANTESLDNLRDNLRELGKGLEDVPLVFSYNKRDLDDVLAMSELDRALNSKKSPSFSTSASRGEGVFEPLDAIVRTALDDLVKRKVLPPELIVPQDGTVAQRLSSVQADVPSASVEPAHIVAGTGAPPLNTPTVVPPTSVSPSAGIELALHSAVGAMNTVDTSSRLVPALRPTAPSIESALAREVAAYERATNTEPGSHEPGEQRTTSRRSASLAPLFDIEEQEAMRTIEDAIEEGLHARALLLLEALLVRLLDRTARILGRAEGQHEGAAWALGLAPERYARVRSSAQRVRRGTTASRREVLEAYVLASSAQIALDAISGRS